MTKKSHIHSLFNVPARIVVHVGIRSSFDVEVGSFRGNDTNTVLLNSVSASTTTLK